MALKLRRKSLTEIVVSAALLQETEISVFQFRGTSYTRECI